MRTASKNESEWAICNLMFRLRVSYGDLRIRFAAMNLADIQTVTKVTPYR